MGFQTGAPRRLRDLALALLLLVGLCVAALPATASAKERPVREKRVKVKRERPAKEGKQSSAPAGPFYERVAYGPKLGELADIWASPTPNSRTIILIHGGGWRKQGGLSYLKKQALSLQAQGFTVFSINYRQDTASKPAFPLEPQDVILATQWAIAHAASYDANPANVVLVGGSAGGNLAELAAEQLDTAEAGTVKAVVSLSGPTDFETLIPLVEDGTIHNKNFITSIYRAIGGDEEEGFFGGEGDEGEEVALTQALMREGSPVMHIPAKANCPNWLLFSSEEDLVPLPQAEEMYGNLLKAGCKATLQVVPGSQHAFAYWNHVEDSVFSFIAAE